MVEVFITEQVANFVTVYYEVKNYYLYNSKFRYNDADFKKGGFNVSLFKGKFVLISVSKLITLDVEEWRNISLYIFNNLTEVRSYIE